MRHKILSILLAAALALPGLFCTSAAYPLVMDNDEVVPVLSAANHVLVLYPDGKLYGWGDNRSGQLGFGDDAPIKYASPVEITFFKGKPRPVQAMAIQDASWVRLVNGDIYTCGSGADGRLGQGDTTDYKMWTLISNSASLGIIDLQGNPNSGSVYGTTGDNTLLAVGQNDVGQLGIDSTDDALSFAKALDNADIQSLHVGKDFAVIVHMDNTISYSGSIDENRTGLIPKTTQMLYSLNCCSLSRYWPATLKTLSVNKMQKFVKIENADYSYRAAYQDMDYANHGQGDDDHSFYPTMNPRTLDNNSILPTAIDKAREIQYGNAHGIMQRADGTYIGWGDVTKKQLLSQATTTEGIVLTVLNDKIAALISDGSDTPTVAVAGDSNFLHYYDPAENSYHTMGWGSNQRGRLGVDSSLASFGDITPIPALDGIKLEQVKDGIGNTYFVSAKGIYAAGDNAYGQLGQGEDYKPLTSNIPILVTIVSPPKVTGVSIPTGWAQEKLVTITAAVGGKDIKDYTFSTAPTAPLLGWHMSPDFTIKDNGGYYAWVRDVEDNISNPYFFKVDKLDNIPPTVGTVTFSRDNTEVTVTGSDPQSGIKGIHLEGDFAPTTNNKATYTLLEGTRYVRIVAEDNAGNLSDEKTQRVPGWFDLLDTLTIEPVEFTVNNQKATITAASTGAAIAGVHVNGTWYKGNPVQYILPYGSKHLELQAQDVNGDRSALYKVRVPGWHEELASLSITGVTFAADNSMAQVTALETAGKGIRHISVNGELLAGSPVQYTIPEGVTHLEIYAENNEGDRSATLIRRVPGWSEVVTTLQISDVAWLDYNTTVQVTATATGGDDVAGIEINGQLQQGNPVIYKIPAGVDLLKLQAVNATGDRSPMVTKQVPKDASKSTLKVSVQSPGWTSSDKVRVRITAEDKSKITQVLARTAEDDEWVDITDERYIFITANTTVYASAENSKGEIREASKAIECFDTQPPTVTATQDGNAVNIRATDAGGSGVAKILVNNKAFDGDAIFGGKLTYQIPAGVAQISVIAEDAAGNLSRAVELPLQVTTSAMPVIVPPKPEPPTEQPPAEVAVPELEEQDAASEPAPTPEPELELEPEQQSSTSHAGQAAAAVGGVGTTAAGGIWYWLRKMKLSKPIEELELLGKKLLYDESEFGGSIDPMDKE